MVRNCYPLLLLVCCCAAAAAPLDASRSRLDDMATGPVSALVPVRGDPSLGGFLCLAGHETSHLLLASTLRVDLAAALAVRLPYEYSYTQICKLDEPSDWIPAVARRSVRTRLPVHNTPPPISATHSLPLCYFSRFQPAPPLDARQIPSDAARHALLFSFVSSSGHPPTPFSFSRS